MRIGILGLSGQSAFMSCDHFHADGETLVASEFHTEPGGKGFNQAVAAARLGAEVVYVTCLGRDAHGHSCAEFLMREGITTAMQWSTSLPTAYANILTDKTGANRVTVYPGAAQQLTAAFVKKQELALAACDCLLLNLECPLPALYAAVEIGKHHGLPMLLNPAPAKPLDDEWLGAFTLITPNRQEAELLLHIPPELGVMALAERLVQRGFNQAVVTLGGDGCLLVEDKHASLFPARAVNAIDTTGAGDCFNAALAVALCEKKTLSEAVAFATHAAAYSVERSFVMPSLPRRDQLAAIPALIAPIPLF